MAPSLVLNLPLVCLAIVQASGFTAINSPPSPHSGRVGGCTQGVAVARLCDSLGDVNEAADDVPPLRILEFYSGIGGLRVSLEAAVKEARLGKRIETTAYEINAVANAVYEHNFPGCIVTRRSIEHLSVTDIDGTADVWLLSPPCQPFCRVGKQMDENDNRSASFVHLLTLLKGLEIPPAYIFLENVKGFEGSQAHRRLLEGLIARGFRVEQYLLSPVQLGIPNTRLRYYCLASRHGTDGDGNISIIRELPPDSLASCSSVEALERTPQQGGLGLRPLSEFLDLSLVGEAVVPLLLSPKASSHATPSLRFDVVTSRSTETTTFTKGYGKHAGRAGPVILVTDDGERRVSAETLDRFPSGLDLGPHGRELRWFSDREMLRLHGFPESFGFPAGLTLRQRFGLIGNSVNVEVVALLLRRMLFGGVVKGGELREGLGRVEAVSGG